MNFIEWCNNNPGFINAIYTFFALILSAIAICISIHTAKIPHKKSGKVLSYHYKLKGGNYYNITFVNTGNTNIRLNLIGVKILDTVYTDIHTIQESIRLLPPSDEVTHGVPVKIIKSMLYSRDLPNKTPIYAFAEDSHGKQYTKKITTFEELKQFFKEE